MLITPFLDPVEKEIEEATSLLARLKWLAYAGVVVALLIVGAYLFKFSGGLSSSHEHWGQF
jgi:hypothetical protein